MACVSKWLMMTVFSLFHLAPEWSALLVMVLWKKLSLDSNFSPEGFDRSSNSRRPGDVSWRAGVYTPRHVCIGVWGVWRFTLLTGTFSSEINKLTSYSDYKPLSSRTGREFSTTNTTGTIVPFSSRLEEIYSSLVVLVLHMSFHSPPAYHHLCAVNMCIIDIWLYCCDISWFVVRLRMIDYL